MEDMMPLHFGPVSAWTVMLVTAALLALVEYLRRTFATTHAVDSEAKALAQETLRLERQVSDRLQRMEKNFDKLVTQDQHRSFGERIGVVEKEAAEAKVEARHARDTSSQASNDVRFLAQRMEDVVSGAISELKEQVKELARQGRANGGRT